ncbi:hypothetical protein [Saccharothrix deserti]|uniref:hypothetical protein n=1 Tax=Saccharothrix deserti TaxID=2593674 RepID=UPI00131C4090|nr:hypothetical protein [Saccharothrix deserti]
MTARRATGRPPRYCPPDVRDCQARARTERVAARAAQTTGGPIALRQIALDLAGQIDEAWEPVQELTETVQTARDLLEELQRELVDRVEQAERAAEAATAAKEQAELEKAAAETARNAATDDARTAREERTKALRARDEAETLKRQAELRLERVTAERDAARTQAEQAATTAAATVAAITAAADQRVQAATGAETAAREQAAELRTELKTLRERLTEQQQRLHASDQAAERLRTETAQRIEQITAEADRKVDQARAEITALRTQQEDRAARFGQQLGAQTERADRLQHSHDRYRALLDRIADTVRQLDTSTSTDANAEGALVDETTTALRAVATLIQGRHDVPHAFNQEADGRDG